MRIPAFTALLPLAHLTYATTTTLQQPSCDDNSPPASTIFRTIDHSRACSAALSDYQDNLALAKDIHESFLGVMADYEWTQNRLCRWQRLVQPPPTTREAHTKAFVPVVEAYELVEKAERDVRAGFEVMRGVCGSGRELEMVGVGEEASYSI